VYTLALVLIAISAVMHASWNILLKSAGDPLRTATIGIVTASFLLLPGAVIGWIALGQPSVAAAAWPIGIASGVVEVAYFVFLAAAYQRGDLSLVAPLARGSAPLFAVAIGVGVLGERLAPEAWIGVALVLAGLLVVQRPWRLLRAAAKAHDRAAAGFALLTGATIVTYSALDTVGVAQAPSWLYAAILWSTCAVGLVVVAIVRGRLRPTDVIASNGHRSPKIAIAGGILTLAGYLLVLGALSRAPLALVAPLRESAVLLTALWGILRLREATERREIATRVTGALLVLAGAAVLAVAG